MNIRKNNEERRPIYFPIHLIYDKYCSALNVNLLKRGKSNEKNIFTHTHARIDADCCISCFCCRECKREDSFI
ncbi:hypothetical protein ERG27_14225 [Bacillus amyloliquefaciens]|nr:hypothetical protein DA376_17620 [Bacillus velezensis]MDE4458911.1 hypothetical protein [Bacillus amyloliquefaciens]QJC43659.1 hypothetical protein FHJ82_17535 [Bacillus sp. HNA3]AWE18056.1 hypothetical protein DDE72_18835 [Bacillus velezensis]AXY71915.1 hypothetical protein D3N19_17530 [Bacillus velezensis]